MSGVCVFVQTMSRHANQQLWHDGSSIKGVWWCLQMGATLRSAVAFLDDLRRYRSTGVGRELAPGIPAKGDRNVPYRWPTDHGLGHGLKIKHVKKSNILNAPWRRECQSTPIERQSIFDFPGPKPTV
jgi:hypothetical protein